MSVEHNVDGEVWLGNSVFWHYIDTAKEPARFGIREDQAVNCRCDRADTALNYEVMPDTMAAITGGST